MVNTEHYRLAKSSVALDSLTWKANETGTVLQVDPLTLPQHFGILAESSKRDGGECLFILASLNTFAQLKKKGGDK